MLQNKTLSEMGAIAVKVLLIALHKTVDFSGGSAMLACGAYSAAAHVLKGSYGRLAERWLSV